MFIESNKQERWLGPRLDTHKDISLLSNRTSYADFLDHQFEVATRVFDWDALLTFGATLRITQCEDGLSTDIKVDQYNWAGECQEFCNILHDTVLSLLSTANNFPSVGIRSVLIKGLGPNTRMKLYIGMWPESCTADVLLKSY